MTKAKAAPWFGIICAFVLRDSFDIGHSDFVIFQSLLTSAATARSIVEPLNR